MKQDEGYRMKDEITICVKGGGDISSGVAWRLHQCGFRVLITETPRPMAVRRKGDGKDG